MAMELEKITMEAMQLPMHQRLALAGFLLETDDSSADPKVREAWDREIQERIEAIDSGSVAGVSYQNVMREAERRLAS